MKNSRNKYWKKTNKKLSKLDFSPYIPSTTDSVVPEGTKDTTTTLQQPEENLSKPAFASCCNKQMEIDASSPSSELSLKFVSPGVCYRIELVKGVITPVYFMLSSNSGVVDLIEYIKGDDEIALDLEWKPDFRGRSNPIALLQFGGKNGVAIIRHIGPSESSARIAEYLSKTRLIMKGAVCDRRKIKETFNVDVKIEDLEKTRLRKYNLPMNFQAAFDAAVGAELTNSFKDKKITRSNWEAKRYTEAQLLYAAFDGLGTYMLYKSLVEQHPDDGPFIETIPKSKEQIEKERAEREAKRKVNRERRRREEEERNASEVPLEVRERPTKAETAAVIKPAEPPTIRSEFTKYYKNRHLTDSGICKLCKKSFGDIDTHMWISHPDIVLEVFLNIANKYQKIRILKSLNSSLNSVTFSDGEFTEKKTGKKYPNYYEYFTDFQKQFKPGKNDKTPPFEVVFLRYLILKKVANKGDQSMEDAAQKEWIERGEQCVEMFLPPIQNFTEEQRQVIRSINIPIIDHIDFATKSCKICHLHFLTTSELKYHFIKSHCKTSFNTEAVSDEKHLTVLGAGAKLVFNEDVPEGASFIIELP